MDQFRFEDMCYTCVCDDVLAEPLLWLGLKPHEERHAYDEWDASLHYGKRHSCGPRAYVQRGADKVMARTDASICNFDWEMTLSCMWRGLRS